MKTFQFFALILSVNLLFSCGIESQNWYGPGIKGEGPLVTKSIDLPAFDAFGLSIDADVYLSQGSQSVRIEAQQNILDNIKKEVNGKSWNIKYDKNVGKHEPVKIWISVPDLTSIAVSGSGNVNGESSFKGLGDLKLAVSGSGNIGLNANSSSLSAAVSGSGDMNLEGSTGDCQISISGSGDIDAEDLQARNCSVRIAGSGDASVNVKETLDVAIAGSGDVVYSGNPKVKSKISGSGDVRSN